MTESQSPSDLSRRLERVSHVKLSHGGGGRLSRELEDHLFRQGLGTPPEAGRCDAGLLELGGASIAVAADSFVVHPLFFPGGDIGTLAVYGTVNDLAMCGARPSHLCAALILEEGLSLDALQRVIQSMRTSAERVGARFQTGDAKVVDRGKGDGLYVSIAGFGVVERAAAIGPAAIRPGDAVLINGDIARHGLAIVSARHGLGYERSVSSDCAPLVEPVQALLRAGVRVRCLCRLNRGGLAGRLDEVARQSGARIELVESDVPVRSMVREACEFLGLDPLNVSSEGRFVAFVDPRDAERALAAMRESAVAAGATRIGQVGSGADGLVALRGAGGASRVLDARSGEQLPRGG